MTTRTSCLSAAARQAETGRQAQAETFLPVSLSHPFRGDRQGPRQADVVPAGTRETAIPSTRR